MPPKGTTATTKKQGASRSRSTRRDKSCDSSKLDQSMKSAKSTTPTKDSVKPAALQAQQELELQQSFNSITEQILTGAPESSTVTVVMKRTLILMMRKSPALFQKTLIYFVERLISFEGDEALLKNFHLLLTRLFHECIQQRDRANGVKLTKSLIRYLLDMYHLPKLQQKVQTRCGHMLTLIINATAQKPATQADDKQPTKGKQSRVFMLLEDNRYDDELRRMLEETVITMLALSSITSAQNQGIQIASLISNFVDDDIFNQLCQLLIKSNSSETRKKIIKSLQLPYTAPTLAFLGKRLRDENPSVTELVFQQFIENGVTICQFPTPEARMLVLTEGFTATKESVRQKCIEFLKPTVVEYAENNNIAGLLKLIEAKLSFGNQYFGRMPGLLALVILEILDQDTILADYLEKIVLKKIYRFAGISLSKKKLAKSLAKNQDADDFEMLFNKPQQVQDTDMISEKGSEQENEEMQTDVGVEPPNFEEVLLLRLTYEINHRTKNQRSQTYVDKLEEIMPEFEDYRKITHAFASMQEVDLPAIDPKIEAIKPYPKGQVGFTRRAILGEWIKFSLQLNIQDEIIRKNLTSLCFDLIGSIENSFTDYEHLLKKGTQLLKGDPDQEGQPAIVKACFNDEDEMASDIEDLIDKDSRSRRQCALDFKQKEEETQINLVIRTFDNIGTMRSLQEYCKPFAMEALTLDYDDVCQVAMTVAKTLLGDRVDEFQLKIMEAISDIKETIQDENQEPNQQPAAQMIFSQMPNHQQPELQTQITFQKMREKFEKGIQQKAEACQVITDADVFDLDAFKKQFRRLNIFIELSEETYLKEKLSYKRALILCRSLLKQCRLANVNDHNVISICETLIHPAVLNNCDQENTLLAFECIGLICILDKDVFLNYSKIFTETLQSQLGNSIETRDNKREKIIAIKSVVDGLIIHGLSEDKFVNFFKILTTDYLTIGDPILRQVAIEGVCKMLFTTKLCDQNDPDLVESILSQLLFQQFDQKHNRHNSLVKSVLKQFICNFVLFSEQRCKTMLNALTKVTYSVLKERYGLDKTVVNGPAKKGKKGKKGKQPQAKAKRKRMDSDSDSDTFDLENGGYQSDDSIFAETKVQMRQVCSSVDFIQMCKILMVLLSKKYVNGNNGEGGFKLKQELSIVFFMQLLKMNKTLFKKTQIVKEIMIPILEAVEVEGCDSLSELRDLEDEWSNNAKMLVNQSAKTNKFQDRLQTRIHELEEIVEEIQQCTSGVKQDVVMEQVSSPAKSINQGSEENKEFGFSFEELDAFWLTEIEERVVDRGADDDRELLQMQQIWIDLTTRDQHGLSNSAKKSILKSPSNFGMRLGNQYVDASPSPSAKKKTNQIRPRRGGRQAAQKATKKVAETALPLSGRITTGLQPIAEETGASQSARPRRVVIVEEAKDRKVSKRTKGPTKSEVSEEDYESESAGGTQSYLNDDDSSDESDSDQFESSQGVEDSNLGRIAKGVARDFARNSKRLSAGSAAQQKYGRGLNTIKLEQPSLSVPKVKKENLSDSKAQKSVSPRKSDVSSVKKELIKDFDLSEAEAKPVQAQKRGRMRTRAKNSNYSRSQSSNADVSQADESDDMYDFMDGTATKNLKKRKQQAMPPPKPKPAAALKREQESGNSLDVSKSSIKSKSSMRTRKQRKVQQ